MKPKTTIVLIVLLLACVGFIAIRRIRRAVRDKDGQKPVSKLLFSPQPGSPKRLTVVHADGRKWVFQKDKDDWRIVEPVKAKARKWKVKDIADPFKDLKYEEVYSSKDDKGVDEEKAGLEDPRWTLRLVDQKDAEFVLHVGERRPMAGDQTYVRPQGQQRFFAVKVDFAEKLSLPLRDYRDKSVLDLASDDIVRIQVAGRENYELLKGEDGWGIVKPISWRADEDKVSSLRSKIAHLSASEFVEDAPSSLAPYGLEAGKARLVVRVWMKPEEPPTTTAATQTASAPAKWGESYGVALGGRIGADKDEKVYAKLLDSPAVFTVEASLLKDLQPKLADIRGKKVLALTADEVTKVELALPGGAAVLEKKDDAWHMTGPFAGKANADQVKEMLDKIASLKADSFHDNVVGLAGYGLDPPTVRLTLHLAGKGETVALLIGAKSSSGEMTFVKSAAGPSVAVVATGEAEHLLAEPAAYWAPTLLKVPGEAKVTELVVKRPDETFTLERKDDKWSLTAPVAAAADESNVNKVIDSIKELKATRIVALGDRVPDKYAQAKEIIALTVTTLTEPASQPAETQPTATQPAATQPAETATRPAPEPVRRTYALHAVKMDDKAYAWVDGRKIVAVGQFATSLYDDLAAELRARQVLKIEPDDVKNVKITAGEDKLELERREETWTYTPDPLVTIDAEKVGDFLKDIKEIEAEKFVSHKSADSARFGLDAPALAVELTPAKGPAARIVVSKTGPDGTEDRYATAAGVAGVFVLSKDTVEKLSKGLKDFKK